MTTTDVLIVIGGFFLGGLLGLGILALILRRWM